MKHVIIGTAGHIDHGKTTLIKALTGRNTDRWKEEQERGITIDLGFTWMDLENGERAGIIDVPGHEKFIKHMTAGVVGMDAVMLVIAADEGIMPQTREHMAILNLLGVEQGIVVLNKCDLVDADWLELMTEDIREQLAGSFLEAAPILCVSAATGEGLDALREAITALMTSQVVQRDVHTIPRLPVDRVFTMDGFGTIVTGTLISGSIEKEDIFCLYPEEKLAKVRNIQVHGQNVDRCEAGQRVALNITNLKKQDVYRGCVLAPAQSMKKSGFLDVRLKMLPDAGRTLTHMSRLHLYSGTSEVLCRAFLLDKEEIRPGESGLVQLRLEQDVAFKRGDHFVVRFYSPVETIGGGVILDANSRKKKRFDAAVIDHLLQYEEGSLGDVMAVQAKTNKEPIMTLKQMASLMAHSEEELMPYVERLANEGTLTVFHMKKDTYIWHADRAYERKAALNRWMTAYHEAYPYRFGPELARAHSSLFRFMKPNIYNTYIERLEAEGFLRRRADRIALTTFDNPDDACYRFVSKRAMQAFEAAGYYFLRISDIDFGDVDLAVVMDILLLMCDQGLIVLLNDDTFTLMSLMNKILDVMDQHFEKAPMITIMDMKELLNTTRRNIRLIFEYTDKHLITRKSGGESEREKY